MIHVDQMSLRVPMADAYKNAGFATKMTIVETTVTRSHVHQPHANPIRNLLVQRIIVSRQNGGVTANQIVPMEMMRE